MRKLIYTFVLIFLGCCSSLGDFDKEDPVPASVGKYKIDVVINEVSLKRLYPDAGHSGCGLSDGDFIKYAMSRVDYRRKFQFIVFIDGKPLVGERCLRRAFIFYSK